VDSQSHHQGSGTKCTNLVPGDSTFEDTSQPVLIEHFVKFLKFVYSIKECVQKILNQR
jgi:hypothetical protein